MWVPEPYRGPQTRATEQDPRFRATRAPLRRGSFFFRSQSRGKLRPAKGGEPLSHQDIQGGCMCGAVRYSATVNPANSMICHCQSCRRAAASPVVAWVTFAKAEFRFTRGTPLAYESSPKVKRRFCGA